MKRKNSVLKAFLIVSGVWVSFLGCNTDDNPTPADYLEITFPGLGFKHSLYYHLDHDSHAIELLTDEPVDNSYIPRVKTIGFKALAGIEIPLKRNNK